MEKLKYGDLIKLSIFSSITLTFIVKLLDILEDHEEPRRVTKRSAKRK